jgi:TolB-like protein/AraC-like DNA-binding protein/Tfp pilus assembly protein PilF
MQEDFISRVTEIISENVADEQFGVSELASRLHVSRSTLLRKIKKLTGLSASQFIRQVRLEMAFDLLKSETYTVSEVSFKVGFGSTSYFIKCFREHYGYPPGEVGRQNEEIESAHKEKKPNRLNPKRVALPIIAIVLIAALIYMFRPASVTGPDDAEKSIAVLPFKNESSDSANVYFINGLMESTLNNLQKIEDLRVLSRTSVEKYRNGNMSIPEIAEELGVNYFVEGSGQKVGDQVLLHIQLIEAATDRHMWSEQYSREVSDVFALQNEVATKIANAIQALVTPEELERIEKIPTDNLEAYDLYLQSREPIFLGTKEGFDEAIHLLEKAIELDPEFALAYADLSIAYYFLDLNQTEKRYTDIINNYADKAVLYDSRSDISLLAKAFYYMHTEEYRLALPYLEKALEYNPNSSVVIQSLSDYYARIVPNTSKYLEYALKGLQINSSSTDSTASSYLYLHLSNAFIQSGFVDEAVRYINKSLEYDPQNYYAPYVKAYIMYAKDLDIAKTRTMLLNELSKNPARLDILQEVAKIYFYEENYEQAYIYYDQFTTASNAQGLDIYPQEDIRIAVTLEKMGMEDEAASYVQSYAEYCEEDQSIYKEASMAVLHAYRGEYEKAIEQMNKFAMQDNIQYWILLFTDEDPIMKPLQAMPEYQAVMQRIEDRFWNNHEEIRNRLKAEGLI